MRTLWLVFERLPHPEAVAYPAGEQDVEFVLELLERPYPQRVSMAGQLRAYLEQQQKRSVFDRPCVPCRRASGLYHLVPWRLAQWLACVLIAPDAVIQRTAARLRTWRTQGEDAEIAR